jgi:hypothetical protein
MASHLQGSLLSGTIGGISYRGLLSAELTDTAFVISLLGSVLLTVPLTDILEVRIGSMPSDFGIKVYYRASNELRVVHLRVLNASEWGQAFAGRTVPVIETPAKTFDMQYFLPMMLLVVLAGAIFLVYFLVVLR